MRIAPAAFRYLYLRRACLTVALTLPLGASAAAGQEARPSANPLTETDSTLIYEVLVAEERRDASAPALQTGIAHPDARVRRISRRAVARITDSTFAARDSLGRPDARPFPRWPLPEWEERFRALSASSVGCDTLYGAIADSAVQVRLRAIALAGNQQVCRAHPGMLAALDRFVRAMPANTIARRVPGGSWHEGATALLSYALLAPDSARPLARRHAEHAMPPVRRAAARAAVAMQDTSLLLRLARDRDANVAESAIQGLSRLTGHRFDSLYIARLATSLPQVALAAAQALQGSAHPEAIAKARQALAIATARDIASERDVRSALRAVLGDSSPEPWSLRERTPLPREAVALALGAARFIEVISSRLHGGASFTVELRGDVAPIMAARILERVRAQQYNGQRWHRVEPGFVIQGGSPLDNEYSGAEYFLVDELSSVPHPRGSVGMSTRGHDTGDAQWFINLRDNARLTRDYTVFGVVVSGMDVVDRVLEGDEFYVMREVSATRRPARP